MAANLLLPPTAQILGEWIDHTANLVVRYDEAILSTITVKTSRYCYLTAKTIHWKASFVQPAGVSSSYVLSADLPLPGKTIGGQGWEAIGSASVVRPGVWFATSTTTRQMATAGGQRAIFMPEYPGSEAWGKPGASTGPTAFVPNDQFWWDATYELA